MADEYRPANPEQVEYKAYARQFEHAGEADEEERRRGVLFLVATLSYPDSGWQVILVPQEGEPDTWRLLEDEPPYRDGDRTYYIASGSSEHELEMVPKSVKVIDGRDETRVSVVPWD